MEHPQTNLEKELRHHKISKYFIVAKGSVYDKENEIKNLLKNFSFDKEETAYVGDMSYDIKVGKKVGVKTIAVCWGYENEKKLQRILIP